MVLIGLIGILKAVIDFFVNLLPAKDTDILAKEYDVVVFGAGKFMSLAYYYLPMAQIDWWIHKFVPLLLLLITIKLVAKLLGTATGGVIHLPWR
jgi:hypothetical protein